MAVEFSAEKAKAILDGGMAKAQEMMKDPSKIDDLLKQLEVKLKDIPYAGSTLARVPLTVSLVKAYITKQYTVVSPKVIATLVSAFIYLVANKDLIPDHVPVVGHLDDIAVLAIALKFVDPELQAFEAFRDGNVVVAEAEGQTE
ncbi:MAG: DUF1232 domain-containing protein [Firmicutes bacterium]|nr:DUF1232 domain-containing protein [Bacillota bacterium]